MRDRRLIFISMLAIFLVIGISLGSASALGFDAYDETWYKVKVKLRGFCEEETDGPIDLVTERADTKAWIYIKSLEEDTDNASLVTQNDDETWQATTITLTFLIGTPDRAVYESNEITIDNPDDPDEDIVLFFIVKLIGKENKKGELRKTTRIRNVGGIAEVLVDGTLECVTRFSVNGVIKKEDDVPDEVFDAVFP